MPRQKQIPDLEVLAARYSVTTRTIRRWHHVLGADVHNPESVADLLLKQRNPKAETIKILIKQLPQ